MTAHDDRLRVLASFAGGAALVASLAGAAYLWLWRHLEKAIEAAVW